MSMNFPLHHPAVQALIHADDRLAQWIRVIGPISLPDPPMDEAHGLAEMIVAQQLSGKVAVVIWERVMNRFGQPLDWTRITQATIEELRILGLSRGKAIYLQQLALKIIQEPHFFHDLSNKSDEYVINELVKLKGIGPWTAHMYLMFVLHRLDVVAGGDLGLRQSLERLYHLPQPINDVQFETLTRHLEPYRTLASLYLWRAHEQKLP